MTRESWSWSKLQRLVRCPEAYRRQEIEKEYPPPTSAMVRGTALHHVAAEGHMRQMRARLESPTAPKSLVLRTSLPTEDEAADMAATRFEFERTSVGIAAASDEPDPADKVIGKDKDAAVKMSRFYVGYVAEFVDPIAVERKVVVEPADSDIRLAGVIDLVSKEPDGTEVVRDIKSKARRPNAEEASDSDQLTMYALLRKLETGKLPERVALDHIVQESGHLRPPYKVTQTSQRTEADLGVMVARLNNAIESVRAGVFLASGVGQWFCSPKFCRFYDAGCQFVRRK